MKKQIFIIFIALCLALTNVSAFVMTPVNASAAETSAETESTAETSAETESTAETSAETESVSKTSVSDTSIEITELGSEYTAQIDNAGGSVYFSFTPSETGDYIIYTGGNKRVRIFLYDSDLNRIAYDADDDGEYIAEAGEAIITHELEAGETYYIRVKFLSSQSTGSIPIFVEKYFPAVSAEAILTESIILYPWVDSSTQYDENGETFAFYSFPGFQAGDQVIVTYSNGSSITYTFDGSYLYDERGYRLRYTTSYSELYSEQESEHWYLGGSYNFTLTLYNHALKIEIEVPVTVGCLDTSAEITELREAYTVRIDDEEDYKCFSFTPSESCDYKFYSGLFVTDINVNFIKCYIYDSVGNPLEDSSSLTSESFVAQLEAGETYYIVLFPIVTYSEYMSFPVIGTIVIKKYDPDVYIVSTELICAKGALSYIEGLDSSSIKYDEDGEAYAYYSFDRDDFSNGDQIIVTYSDGSSNVLTYSGGMFFDTAWNTFSSHSSSTQDTEHWYAGGSYYFTWTLYTDDGDVTVEVPVSIISLEDADIDITELAELDTEYTAQIDNLYGSAYFSFTPSESVMYSFYSTGDNEIAIYRNTYTYLYDSDLNLLAQGSSMIQTLEAGETYYIRICFSQRITGSLTVTAAKYEGVISETTASVTLSPETCIYNGEAKEPTPTVEVDGITLTEGTDYTVSYSNNIEAGYGLVTITGIGFYSGSVTVEFEISPKSVSAASVTLSESEYVYNGSARKPTPTVVMTWDDGSSVTLSEGTDYTVSYSDNTDAGTATVTITGTGNYGGTLNATFTIKQKTISSSSSAAQVTLSKSECVYNGSARKPTPTVKITLNGETTTLKKGTDYTVTYKNNTNVGTATVTITGTGNYKGTLKTTFTIKQKTISSSSSAAKVTLSKTSYTYNGKAKTPTPTVKITLNGKTTTLKKGTRLHGYL